MGISQQSNLAILTNTWTNYSDYMSTIMEEATSGPHGVLI